MSVRKHAESTKDVASINFQVFETRKQSEYNLEARPPNNPTINLGTLQVGERSLEDFQDAESSAWKPPLSRTRMLVEGKSTQIYESVST